MAGYITRIAGRAAFVLGLVSSIPHVAYGQNPTPEPFTLHGYFTQAYAKSSDLPILGATTSGRVDYQVMVLQIRYNASENDEFVTQLRHRHFGASPLTAIEPEVVISWAYYKRRVGPLGVRVGRVPLEQGIYNETRFVGTFVPFFRAPVSIYPEGIESIDGVALSYETPSVAGWSAQGTLSGGTSHYQDVIQTPVGTATPRLLFNPDLAAQFWIITPLQGLRFGANTRTIHYKRDSTTFHNPLWTASVDGTFNRFFVRAEHSEYNVRFASIYLILRYIQGGVEIAKGLSLTYQYDFQHWGYATRAPEISYDRAGGITYAITPNLHLKLERHRATGYRFDQYVAPVTGPGRTTYTIGSVSHSF